MVEFDGGRLHGDNRWVKMNDPIPWDEVEERHRRCFTKKKGCKAKNVRLAPGALIVKEKLKLTDEETVEQIRENHYLQFFLGFEGCLYERRFEASMMTYFRRRLGPEAMAEVNEIIARKFHEEQETQARQEAVARKEKHDDDMHDDDQGNHGQFLLDATCAPQDMRHPGDVLRLNESREKTEHIIDVLHDAAPGTDKPRSYRKVARREFLVFMHSRKRTKRMVRMALRKQIAYVKRNLATIDEMGKGIGGNPLSARLERDLVESVFGVGKRRYGLDRIMARNKRSSESMTMLTVLVMDMEAILRDLLFVLYGSRWNCALQRLQSAWQGFRRTA